MTLSTEAMYKTMTTAEAEFRGIEFSANRALAYAILAAEAPNGYVMFYRLLKVLAALEKFIPFLTPDYLESLADSQQRRLSLRMQEAHTILTRLLRSPEAASIVRVPSWAPLSVDSRRGQKSWMTFLKACFSLETSSRRGPTPVGKRLRASPGKFTEEHPMPLICCHVALC